jgi:hypothetical protein
MRTGSREVSVSNKYSNETRRLNITGTNETGIGVSAFSPSEKTFGNETVGDVTKAGVSGVSAKRQGQDSEPLPCVPLWIGASFEQQLAEAGCSVTAVELL